MLAPVKAEPADVLLDGIDVFDVLPHRIGVIKAEVASRVRVFARNPEVEADRLGVADVQIAVGFGRESGEHPALVFAGGQVGVDELTNEIPGGCGCIRRGRGRVLACFHVGPKSSFVGRRG